MCNHQCRTIYNVTKTVTSDTEATLFIDGTLSDTNPRFTLCIDPCKDLLCSGLQVVIQDLGGNVFTVFNRHANYALLGQVEVQAIQCGRLHMTRSMDLPHNVLWQNTPKCAPTPVLSSTSYVKADVEVAPIATKE